MLLIKHTIPFYKSLVLKILGIIPSAMNYGSVSAISFSTLFHAERRFTLKKSPSVPKKSEQLNPRRNIVGGNRNCLGESIGQQFKTRSVDVIPVRPLVYRRGEWNIRVIHLWPDCQRARETGSLPASSDTQVDPCFGETGILIFQPIGWTSIARSAE